MNFTPDNKITILQNGAEYFPSLVQAFDAAKIEIFLETYIFAADATGELIKDALRRAASRGVTVNVITDWLGTGNAISKSLAQDFAAGGVNYRSFNPWFREGVARTHRKICVVDREFAFLGGLNTIDDWFSDDDERLPLPAPRWDFAVKVAGPLVKVIHLEAEAQWARFDIMKLKSRWTKLKQIRTYHFSGPDRSALAGLVVRDNLRNRRTIQRSYLRALNGARHSALLANPYFAPGRTLRAALEAAAERGVKVTLLLGVGQFRLQDAMAHAFYPQLLRSGVTIVEYHKTQLHGKVAVVDDDWATVGSSNYDGLSLFVNQEANIVVKDARFSAELRRHIEAGIADGVSIRLEDYVNIPWYKRVWYSVVFGLYQGMIRVVTWSAYN